MRFWISLSLAFLLLTACGKSVAMTDIVGSDTMLELAQSHAEMFYRHTQIPVSISGGGSGVGITSLIQGDADAANVSREVSEEEFQSARGRSLRIIPVRVAKDALAIVVNKDNPVKNLTLQQLGDMYLGKITNWKEVGGKDSPISLYGRQSSSGTYVFFQETVLHKKDFISSVKEMTGNSQILSAINNDKNSIAYVGLGYAQNPVAKILALEGVIPSLDMSEKYVLSRYLYVVITDHATERDREWIRFNLSALGQEVVSKTGYIELTEEELAQENKKIDFTSNRTKSAK